MTILGCEEIWHNGPTQLLRDIFAITKTEGVETLETAVKQSNCKWIRPKGFERWHDHRLLDNAERKILSKRIEHSALAREKIPIIKNYDVVAVLGTTTLRVKGRIDFLVRLYAMGITADKIYLLGSTRDLKTGDESDQAIAKVLENKAIAATEMTAMNYLWQQTLMPPSLKTVQIALIQSSERPDGARANTEDTLVDMLKDLDDVSGKDFLFISSNPYICYQDAVAKKVLAKHGARVETAGEAMTTEATMENVLDTVARCLTNLQR